MVIESIGSTGAAQVGGPDNPLTPDQKRLLSNLADKANFLAQPQGVYTFNNEEKMVGSPNLDQALDQFEARVNQLRESL